MVIFFTPKGIFLSVYQTLTSFSRLEIFEKRKIQSKNFNIIETMGEVDTIVFEHEGTFTNTKNLRVHDWIIFGQEQASSPDEDTNHESSCKLKIFKDVNSITKLMKLSITAWFDIKEEHVCSTMASGINIQEQ